MAFNSDNLVLNKTLLINRFGFEDLDDMLDVFKNIEKGYDSTDKSYFVYELIGRRPELETKLISYDEKIKTYVEKLKRNRGQDNFLLEYFQYLAVLSTEMYLDMYFNRKNELLNMLNENLKENYLHLTPYTEKDLSKLAYWMATGSGKTLIMHINYWQMLNYIDDWDNIILLTPNEDMSKQHEKEMKLSGIPCKIYNGNIDDLKPTKGEVLIIDVYKIKKDKKGKGVTVDIKYLEGRNLVFVDEGHKGQASEEKTWKEIREKLGNNGFIFEYSATFGQVIGSNKELENEYSKSIIFDYSYKYFYGDGYGKDFYVYNMKDDKYNEEQIELLLTANLLSYYEQLLIYENNKDKFREYFIEKPLWVFVGSKASGKGINSDVVKVVRFLDKVTRKREWLKNNIEKILSGKSELLDNEGNDLFNDKFKVIKELREKDKLSIDDIYKRIFLGEGYIEFREIKRAEGEIGLKINTSNKYFGVINVGDQSTLIKLIKEAELEVGTENFQESLFKSINSANSSINILIGAKKFIEGWNSWRVSNMGLIHIGKGEGPQIIQLFGRGVRLKGKNYCLKRENTNNYELNTLQTLYVFGLDANYIHKFLNAIEDEDVKIKTIEIPIKTNISDEWQKKIYTIRTNDEFNYLDYKLELNLEEEILNKVVIDLRPKIFMGHGIRKGEQLQIKIDKTIKIPDEYIEMLDWNEIYMDIIKFKIEKRYYNLVLNEKVIKDLAKSKQNRLYITKTNGIEIADDGLLKLTSFEGIEKLKNIIKLIIKDYINRYYLTKLKQEEMNNLTLKTLKEEISNELYPEKVIIKIPENKLNKEIRELIEKIEKYNNDKDKIIEVCKGNEEIPMIWFNNFVYVPLIINKKGKEYIKSIPTTLNEGETKFIEDLEKYIVKKDDKIDIFVLRNLPKRGIGFFKTAGFYPDFIVWLNWEDKQKIVFIDTKGIRYIYNFNNEKIVICKEDIPKVKKEIQRLNPNIDIEAYIVSVTKYDEIKENFDIGGCSKKDFEDNKILFQEDRDYIEKIMKVV